jgi:capsular polysaccharide biosynthesis protein
MQKRVFSQANDYYFVSKLVDSRVAYIKEKTKPKRALILVVSFVTSIILGIFMVFFYEFIKGNKKDEKTI